MLIRIQTNQGQWRVTVPSTGTPSDVLTAIAQTRPNVVYEKNLSKDVQCQTPLVMVATLESQGVGHGDMIYCRVKDEVESCAATGPAAAAGDVAKDMDIREENLGKSRHVILIIYDSSDNILIIFWYD